MHLADRLVVIELIDINIDLLTSALTVNGKAHILLLLDLGPDIRVVDLETEPPAHRHRATRDTESVLLLLGEDHRLDHRGHTLTDMHLATVTAVEHIIVGALLQLVRTVDEISLPIKNRLAGFISDHAGPAEDQLLVLVDLHDVGLGQMRH